MKEGRKGGLKNESTQAHDVIKHTQVHTYVREKRRRTYEDKHKSMSHHGVD
jgi:hypothetical protein